VISYMVLEGGTEDRKERKKSVGCVKVPGVLYVGLKQPLTAIP
jgi:hypothetical protein